MCVFPCMKYIFRPFQWEIKSEIYIFIFSMELISSAKGKKKFSYSVNIGLWYAINIICDGSHLNAVLFHLVEMTVHNPLVAWLCSATYELCSHSQLMKMKYAVLPDIRNPIFMNTHKAEYINVHGTGLISGPRYTWTYTVCSLIGLNMWLYNHNYIGLRAPFLINKWIIFTEDTPQDVFFMGNLARRYLPIHEQRQHFLF